jgi:hypothetical protein
MQGRHRKTKPERPHEPQPVDEWAKARPVRLVFRRALFRLSGRGVNKKAPDAKRLLGHAVRFAPCSAGAAHYVVRADRGD